MLFFQCAEGRSLVSISASQRILQGSDELSQHAISHGWCWEFRLRGKGQEGRSSPCGRSYELGGTTAPGERQARQEGQAEQPIPHSAPVHL